LFLVNKQLLFIGDYKGYLKGAILE